MKAASKYDELMLCLLEDMHEMCSTNGCARDFKTIKSRIKHEGLSFLTITLPKFLDETFVCLEKGRVDSTDFSGWKKTGCLPSFLKGFTSRVFDLYTGRRLHAIDIDSLYSIRQICSFNKKIQLDCSSRRREKAYTNYFSIEDELKRYIFKKTDLDLFERISRVVVSQIFPVHVTEEDFLPHHGPGSTAETVLYNEKYKTRKFPWYTKLDSFFSRGQTIFPNEFEEFQESKSEILSDEPSVHLTDVPKTLKSPRIIALEPVVMQMTQQGVKDYIVKKIENSPLTAGHVNFTDQFVNRSLVIEGSQLCNLATIDLSEASDRVHIDLVDRMLSVNPSLRKAIFSCRSGRVTYNGKQTELKKFASMGSALCFPIEALCFYILLILVKYEEHIRETKSPSYLGHSLIKKLTQDLYVYGDDLIIPVNMVERAIDRFSDFGMRVNRSKSYWKSSFRESCGLDMYDGCDITPIYMRQPLCSKRVSPKTIISYVEMHNQMNVHFKRTKAFVKAFVTKQMGCTLPSVHEDCEGLGWVDGTYRGIYRYNRNLQRFEVQTFVPKAILKQDKLSGIPALCKCLLRLEQPEFFRSGDRLNDLYLENLGSNEKHLTFSPRRGALTLQRRWVAC